MSNFIKYGLPLVAIAVLAQAIITINYQPENIFFLTYVNLFLSGLLIGEWIVLIPFTKVRR
jgi:hypothetical protein